MSDESGPAFPIFADSAPKSGNAAWGGMTLRDYFAAKAMQGMLATDTGDSEQWADDHMNERLTQRAYIIANAMLKTREA